MIGSVTEKIQKHFEESVHTKKASMEHLMPSIAKAADLMVRCIQHHHKILTCGNGGSACDALHFVSELVGRFERERGSLPAMALTDNVATLTSISNDYHFDEIFAKQVMALGNADDILLAISTSGHSKNVIKAVEAAYSKNMFVVALTGKNGGEMAHILRPESVELRVSSNRTMRIQETHLLIIHILCDLIDEGLFGK